MASYQFVINNENKPEGLVDVSFAERLMLEVLMFKENDYVITGEIVHSSKEELFNYADKAVVN